MARLKCAAEGCQEFAQAGTDYCRRLCQKVGRRTVSAPASADMITALAASKPGASLAMLESTAPRRVHRNERRANGCNDKPASRRV